MIEVDSDEEFENQLEKEREEKQRLALGHEDILDGKRIRKDSDGTVYEFDPIQKAWFPKLNEDFLAYYNLNYGVADSGSDVADNSKKPAAMSDEEDKKLFESWFEQCKTQYGSEFTEEEGRRQWDCYYKWYYSNVKADASNLPKSASQDQSTTPHSDFAEPQPEDINSEEYVLWYQRYYQHYYGSLPVSEDGNNAANTSDPKDNGIPSSLDSATQNVAATSQRPLDTEALLEAYVRNEVPLTEAAAAANKATEDKEGDDSSNESKSTSKEDLAKQKQKKIKPEPVWFEVAPEIDNHVYISGLPLDMKEDEFQELMQKCGIIEMDSISHKLKLKMYKDSNGDFKGDGLCCYIKPESFDLAMQLLDDREIRGSTLKIEKARFELKGSYDPKRKKRKLTNKEKKKFKEKKEGLFGWKLEKPTGSRMKFERVVILKGLFNPAIFKKNPLYLNQLRDQLRQRGSDFGDVKKVEIFDHHQDGIASVTFKDPEQADICILNMNGRLFAGREISAEHWDGKSKYKVDEADKERVERDQQWEKFLEDDDEEADEDSKKDDVKQKVKSDLNISDGDNPPDDADKMAETEDTEEVREENDNDSVNMSDSVVNRPAADKIDENEESKNPEENDETEGTKKQQDTETISNSSTESATSNETTSCTEMVKSDLPSPSSTRSSGDSEDRTPT